MTAIDLPALAWSDVAILKRLSHEVIFLREVEWQDDQTERPYVCTHVETGYRVESTVEDGETERMIKRRLLTELLVEFRDELEEWREAERREQAVLVPADEPVLPGWIYYYGPDRALWRYPA